ncbi:MAG: TlyA family RNA methyltransferase, partial [Nitrospirota bacterium]
MKERLDKILVGKGLAESREKARALIMEGKVFVNGMRISKAGTFLPLDTTIEIRGNLHPYVSRGGIKLQSAIESFNIDVSGKIAIDVGTSTGGFTDCLLSFGAKKVYAVDVGYGQIAWRLRNDPRVIPIERTNIRYIDPSLIKDKIDIAVIDTSFISLEKVLPPVVNLVKNNGEMIALIKPQFEVGKGEVGKGGIVKEENKRRKVLEKIKELAEKLILEVKGLIQSPITGREGNIEYLIYLKK